MKYFERIQKQGQQRMDVCKICPEFKPSTGQCKQCGCFMRAKVLLPMQACPIGKW